MILGAEPEPNLRPPQQERSRRTLERMVRAARALLAEGGVEGVSVQTVVARARASVGSFYARFAGKDELLLHLQEMVWGEANAAWEEAYAAGEWSGLSLAETVEALVGLVAGAGEAVGAERRALVALTGGAAREAALAARIRSDAQGALLEHRPEIRHPDPALATEVGLEAVMRVLAARAGAPAEGHEALTLLDEGRLRSELVRLLLAYLGVGREADEGAEGMEFFDVWG